MQNIISIFHLIYFIKFVVFVIQTFEMFGFVLNPCLADIKARKAIN